MISGYALDGESKEAIKCFSQMQRETLGFSMKLKCFWFADFLRPKVLLHQYGQGNKPKIYALK
jgi:pentatricopeptide repeat protein